MWASGELMNRETERVEGHSFLDLTLPQAVGRDLASAGSVRYHILRRLVIAARWMAWAVLAACIVIGLGYVLDVPQLFRPFANGPATSPLTLILIGLLAICQLKFRHSRSLSLSMDMMLGTVVLLCLFRCAEFFLGEGVVHLSALLDRFAPPGDTGAPARTGLNTTIVALGLSIGFLARFRAPALGLLMAILVPILPLISLIGYSFRLGGFYGDMALTTLLLFLPLSCAMLANYAHKRLLRPLIADTLLGRIARLQLLASLVLPLGLGVMVFGLPSNIHSGWTAVYVGMMVWSICALVVLTARAHEATDHMRRKIERRLVTLSMRDALTGVVNRQGVADALPMLDTASLGVILLDLDFFKQVNDTYGHAVGDSILQQTGEVLRARMRPDDVVARWGGEEFLVLAPDMSTDHLPNLCEDLRKRVANLVEDTGVELTASVGATIMLGDSEGLEEALARADTGLYIAKSKGRNMVVVREKRVPADAERARRSVTAMPAQAHPN